MTAAATPIRVLLVDDSQLVRRGIKTVLSAETEPPLEVVGEAGNVIAAVRESLRLKPDVVLLDVRLPDGTGFDACRGILQALPDTKVLVLSSYANDAYAYEAVTAGVQGYLMKEIDPGGLVQAIRDVAAGRAIVDPEASNRVFRLLRAGGSNAGAADLSILSPQERRVLALVAAGLTNREVGEKLGLSENTVKNYLVNVFEKLQVKRRAQAAAIFVQQSGAER